MLFCNIAYVAQKGGFTEGRKEPFLTEEAAVDQLTKAYFWDKYLIIKKLFKIDKF